MCVTFTRILLVALAAVLTLGPAAEAKKRDAVCATLKKGKKAPYVAIFSAFPAETRPIIASMTYESQVQFNGRPFYLGRIGRVRVIVGLVGIGLVNAETSARAVLDGMDVAAVVFSGVAGSSARIGEVVVPDDWALRDSAAGAFPANPAMLAVARRAQGALVDTLAHCALVPPDTANATERCLDFQPQVYVGGHGSSSDPYGGTAFPCPPGNNLGVLGCGLPPPPTGATIAAKAAIVASAPGSAQPAIVDMETAAVARVAAERDVPFLGIRGVSDGPGDPLGDRGFPAQFFDYYVISADNAAIVARSVVAQLDALAKSKPGRKACKALAKGKWDKAAALLNP
jgi:nucleoside phosphorylase